MPDQVRSRIAGNLSSAKTAERGDGVDWAWRLLEEAHILSQPWVSPHVRVHAAMLAMAVRVRDRREVTGQLVRLVVAGPGSATGRYPVGNTGRARVPATQPMPVPEDLANLLDGSGE